MKERYFFPLSLCHLVPLLIGILSFLFTAELVIFFDYVVESVVDLKKSGMDSDFLVVYFLLYICIGA